VCTYQTEKIEMTGSGKSARGWFRLSHATVYVDHPVHAPFGHTVNVDFLNPELGASARVAVELTEESARALADALLAAFDAAPAGLASATATPPPGH